MTTFLLTPRVTGLSLALSHARERCGLSVLAISLLCISFSCSPLPRKYLHQAEPGVTLTALVTNPETYRGKVVILGGTIVEEKQDRGRLWLRMRNRPLDEDYHPHRPPLLEGPEAGHYWVVVSPDKIQKNYKSWARVTVVGQVVGVKSIDNRVRRIEPMSRSSPRCMSVAGEDPHTKMRGRISKTRTIKSARREESMASLGASKLR